MAVPKREGEWCWRYLPPGVRVWVTESVALVQWSSRGGWVYQSAFVRFRLGPRSTRRQQIMDAIWEGQMKRKDKKAVEALRFHAGEDKLLRGYPEISEFMRSAVYEGEDTVRTSPTVTFWCQSGEWRCSVKDRAEALVMWLSAPTLLELLGLIEAYCTNSDGPWRHDDHEHERNGKRKKKDA